MAPAAEILAVALFVVVFMAGGRNWAARQVALDRCGAQRAVMLAAMPPPGELAIDGADGRAADGALALTWLWRFARGDKRDDHPHFDQLYVAGPGRLCDALADALATEAAVKDIPTVLFKTAVEPARWRRSRRIECAALSLYDPEGRALHTLPFAPIRSLEARPAPSAARCRKAEAPEDDERPRRVHRDDLVYFAPEDADDAERDDRLRHADLVVVAGCPADNAALLQKAAAQLLRSGQSAAWFAPVEAGKAEKAIKKMREALAGALPHARVATLALTEPGAAPRSGAVAAAIAAKPQQTLD